MGELFVPPLVKEIFPRLNWLKVSFATLSPYNASSAQAQGTLDLLNYSNIIVGMIFATNIKNIN